MQKATQLPIRYAHLWPKRSGAANGEFWEFAERVDSVLAGYGFDGEIKVAGSQPDWTVPGGRRQVVACDLVVLYFNSMVGTLMRGRKSDARQFLPAPASRRRTKKVSLKQIQNLIVRLKLLSNDVHFEMSADALSAFGVGASPFSWEKQLAEWQRAAERALRVIQAKPEWPLEEIQGGRAPDPVALAIARRGDEIYRAQFPTSQQKQIEPFAAALFKALNIDRTARTYLEKVWRNTETDKSRARHPTSSGKEV